METKQLAKLQGAGPGSHFIYTDEKGRFVIEWYDFGKDVPYESANMLILGDSELAALADRLGHSGAGAQQIADELAERFTSYFTIRAYLDGAGLKYRHEVDSMP
jgi:hypothetical protein